MPRSASRHTSAAAALRPLLVVLAVLAGLLALPAQAATSTKYYAPSVTPTTVLTAGSATAVVLSLQDCGCGRTTSTQSFGSAEVVLPGAAWTGLSAGVLGVSGTASGKSSHWSATPVGTTPTGDAVVRLRNDGTGTAYAIAPGETLQLSATFTPASDGPVTLATRVKQSNDFSGSGNDFARPAGVEDPVLQVGSGRPDHLALGVQPSTVQSATATTGPGARTVMCPAPTVRVLDAADRLVTWAPVTVGLSSAGPVDPGLKLSGASPVSATSSSGVATFGTCDSGLTADRVGTGYTLRATGSYGGRALTAATSDAFDVLPYLVACGSSCSSPKITGGITSVQVQADDGPQDSSALLSLAVGLDDARDKGTYACNPDPATTGNPYRSVALVDLADHTKTVTLQWGKKAVQWATNNGTPLWQVCLAAAYGFPGSTPAADGWSYAVLSRCDAVDPATTPCLARLYRNAGDQYAVVQLPDVPGDPKMW